MKLYNQSGSDNNPNPFNDWFWAVIWLISDYMLEELPEIAYESACKTADPSFEGYYIQGILINEDGGLIFIHRKTNGTDRLL